MQKSLPQGNSWAPVDVGTRKWLLKKLGLTSNLISPPLAASTSRWKVRPLPTPDSTQYAAMTQTEDHMAEATIGALANLATSTAADRGVVATLTQANSCLVKQLEETSTKLRELKALFHQ
jgi:hypothetical protein